jgi:hypothetical protein
LCEITSSRLSDPIAGKSIAMTNTRPDYFAPAPTPAEAVLRRVKGNTRRAMIGAALERGEPLDSVPADWQEHDLPGYLKNLLQRQHPQSRGGEELPDLLDGEVEIARITLVDSVHGEVCSLRAMRSSEGAGISLRLVDEWETEYALPRTQISQALTAQEVLRLLQDAEPSPLTSSCRLRLDSAFYPGLDDLADRLQVKLLEADD